MQEGVCNSLWCWVFTLANKEIITMEDLSKHDFLVRGKKVSFAIDNYNLKHSNISLGDCSIDTSVELVISTNGITAIPEEMFTHGNLKYNPNIVCKNINHLFQGAYLYALTLKNSILKDSVNFVLNELKKVKTD